VGGEGGPRGRVVERIGDVCGVWYRQITTTEPEKRRSGWHVVRRGTFFGIRRDETKTERI
jgi:hypothetical protein